MARYEKPNTEGIFENALRQTQRHGDTEEYYTTTMDKYFIINHFNE